MPSILVECGFLTNPNEEDFLQSDEGQDYIASAIFRAFRSYKQNLENFETKISQDLNDDSVRLKVNLFHENNVVFKVQIGTYLKSMMDSRLFCEIKPEEVKVNEIFKYYVGAESTKANADEIKKKMLNLGLKGAFVVAFYKDVRISMKEALALQKKINNHE